MKGWSVIAPQDSGALLKDEPSAAPSSYLAGLWYGASLSSEVAVGKTKPITLWGRQILLGRRADGTLFALRDLCPHRGLPLRYGQFDGETVVCGYHGWRFSTDGVCRQIPALATGAAEDPTRIRVRSYPIAERYGVIWLQYGADAAPPSSAMAAAATCPKVDGLPDEARPLLSCTLVFPGPLDTAVIGLIDPAHGPYVHESWWWRSRRSLRDKAKAFGPSHLGFTMHRHSPSKNSAAYRVVARLMGGTPETEIRFMLPGLRVEETRFGDNRVYNMTIVSPIDAERAQVLHVIHDTSGILRLFRPVLWVLMRQFLEQDRLVMARQVAGEGRHMAPIFMADADVQARWYYRLKKAWAASNGEVGAFQNPVPETVLRWRS